MLILITGASRGIGFEIVKAMAANVGLTVLAASRNIASLEKLAAELPSVIPVSCDITSADGRKTLVNRVGELKHQLSAVIHNAGAMVNRKFTDISETELRRVYETNVFAPFLLTQALLPVLSDGAHIVNIGSMGGVNGTSKFPGLSAYSSSKGALSILSECLAEELKLRNIKVNCLALGAVQTEMLEHAFPGYQAPLQAHTMARFICDFTLNQAGLFNGKTLPVSSTTP